MTDIVERLRSRCGRETMNGAYADGMWEDAWSMEAADEIERLRQVLENVQQARVLQGKAITDASNEIERLRAALVDCRVELDDYYMREYRSDDPIIQQRLEEKMASNPARVALEKKHD